MKSIMLWFVKVENLNAKAGVGSRRESEATFKKGGGAVDLYIKLHELHGIDKNK